MSTGTQPNVPGNFQLRAMVLHQDDNNGIPEANVIDVNVPFRVYLEFGGAGITWNGFQGTAQPFTVRYYAEGKGGVPDITLGQVVSNLGVISTPTGTVPASATQLMATISNPGLYELAATVTFNNFPGYAGFVDGLIIQAI